MAEAPAAGSEADTGAVDKVVGRATAYFEEKGLTAVDVPKALVLHEVFGATFLFGMWGVCYAVRPATKLAIPAIRRFSVNNAKKVEAAMGSAHDRIRSAKWINKIPGVKSVDSGRLTVALAESVVFRNLMRPLTVPAKLWLTWYVMVPT